MSFVPHEGCCRHFKFTENLDGTQALRLLLLMNERVETALVLSDSHSTRSSSIANKMSCILGVRTFHILIKQQALPRRTNTTCDDAHEWFHNRAVDSLNRAIDCEKEFENGDYARLIRGSALPCDGMILDQCSMSKVNCINFYDPFGITFVSKPSIRYEIHAQKCDETLANSYLDAIEFINTEPLASVLRVRLCATRRETRSSRFKRIDPLASFAELVLRLLTVSHFIVAYREALNIAHEPVLAEIRARMEADSLHTVILHLRHIIVLPIYIRALQAKALHDVFIWRQGVSLKLDVYRHTLCRAAQDIFTFIIMTQNALGFQNRKLVYRRRVGFIWYVARSDLENACFEKQLTLRNVLSSLLVSERTLGCNFQLSSLELDRMNARFEYALKEAKKSAEAISKSFRSVLASVQSQVGDRSIGIQFLACFIERSTVQSLDFIRPSVNSAEILSALNAVSVCIGDKDSAHSFFVTRCLPLILITGPNLSGKSTCVQNILKTVRLVLSTRSVHADRVDCHLFDFVHSYQTSSNGLFASHFFSDLKKIDAIITSSNLNSLVLLDEPCKSTSPKEAGYILWALLEVLCRRGVKVVFVSHLHALMDFGSTYIFPQVMSLTSEEKPEAGRFTYKLCEYSMTRVSAHYGVIQARSSKLSIDILRRASGFAVSKRHAEVLVESGFATTRFKHRVAKSVQLMLLKLNPRHEKDSVRNSELMDFISCITQ